MDGNRGQLPCVGTGTAFGFRPSEGKMDDTPWALHSFQRLKGGSQDRGLAIGVARSPQGPAKRMLDTGKPGHAHGRRKVGNIRNADGREACGLDLPLYQSHGPAAYRSGRHQEDQVHLILLQTVDDITCAYFKQDSRIDCIPHEGIVPGGGAADLPGGRQFIQSNER